MEIIGIVVLFIILFAWIYGVVSAAETKCERGDEWLRDKIGKGGSKPTIPQNNKSSPTHSTPVVRRPSLTPTRPPAPMREPEVTIPRLKLKVDKRNRQFEDLNLNVFEFSTQGIFSPSRTIHMPQFIITMKAKNAKGGVFVPVLSMLEEWQAKDSNELEITKDLESSLPAGAGSGEWVTLAGVPVDVLNFPNSGITELEITLNVVDQYDDRSVLSIQTHIQHVVTGHGYLQLFRRESQMHGAMIQLALYMASTDGHVDDDETNVIKRWGKRMVKSLPKDHQSERNEKINRSLREATQLIRAGKQDEMEKNAIKVLKLEAEPRELYETYELCLAVIEADGEAHPEEMALLSRIAKSLGLDENKTRKLLDQKISNLSFSFSDHSDSQDKHLGITDDMTKQEIKKHLGKLYRKHNARKNHDDPSVRLKAKEWLDMIADARARNS